jgi:protein O-mannosyl-transferase
MEAIPLISSASDGRNVITCLFYLALGYSAWMLLRAQARRKEVDAPAASARDLISAASLSQCDSLRNGHGFHPHPSASMGSSSSALAALSLSSNNNSSSHLQHQYQVHCLQQLEPARVHDSLDLTVIALSMLVLPFIPATNLFFYVGFVVAERVLYIPSIGYCLAVAIGCHVIHDLKLRTRRLKLLFRLALVVLFLLYAARTVTRNQDWLTEESLYRSGININPPKGKILQLEVGEGRMRAAANSAPSRSHQLTIGQAAI